MLSKPMAMTTFDYIKLLSRKTSPGGERGDRNSAGVLRGSGTTGPNIDISQSINTDINDS